MSPAALPGDQSPRAIQGTFQIHPLSLEPPEAILDRASTGDDRGDAAGQKQIGTANARTDALAGAARCRERLLPGGEGSVDTSRGIELLEIPSRAQLTRALGDIHVYGNTHYALDPLNGIAIGRTLAQALSRADPEHASLFDKRARELERKLRALTERLVRRMEPLSGTRVVTYHRTWPYFLKRFALGKLAEVEPKPGIAPGPGHIARVAREMKENGVGLVIVETFSDLKTAQRLADLAGGRAVVLAQEVNALPGVKTYEALFEHNVETLLAAQRELSGSPTKLPNEETLR